ncbi:MAG: hypothetical protein ACR2RE_18675, partial [Geminicoccaceae bacterium]
LQAVFDESESFFVRLEGDEEVDLVEITTGVLLRVIPRIVDQDGVRPLVHMTIDVEDGSSRLDTGDVVAVVDNIPTVRRSQISTESYVQDGQSLAIGGFYREEVVDDVAQVPLLSSIPIIGSAFRSTIKETENIVRLFLIRPTIVIADLDKLQTSVQSKTSTSRHGPIPLFPPDGGTGRQGIDKLQTSVQRKTSISRHGPIPLFPPDGGAGRQGIDQLIHERDTICASIESYGYSCRGDVSAVEKKLDAGVLY